VRKQYHRSNKINPPLVVAVIMSNPGLVCCVCYGALESEKQGCLECGHIIHVRCWQDLVSHWKGTGATEVARCPYCKTEAVNGLRRVILSGNSR
jgi:hypothetical protein